MEVVALVALVRPLLLAAVAEAGVVAEAEVVVQE